MGEVVPIIFLAVILKIPVLYGMWLIYWAVKAEPEIDDVPGDADDHSFRRFRPSPTKPRGPRRGPHGGGPPTRPHSPPRGRPARRGEARPSAPRLPAGRPDEDAGDRTPPRARNRRPRAARAHPGPQLVAGRNQTGG